MGDMGTYRGVAEGRHECATGAREKVVDIHVHIMGCGDSGTACRISKPMMASPGFSGMMSALGLETADSGDEIIREKVVDAVDTSNHIDYAVLLAFDGVHRNGRYVEAESHLVVPNEYVIDIAKRNGKVLFGASVHPYRELREMLFETDKCIGEGAALFKWVPSSQRIDPEDERCIPLYIRLSREGIPLLCHTGDEFRSQTLEMGNSLFNDPGRLRRALDIGVKVIAAHCAAPGNGGPSLGGRYFEKLLVMLRESEEKKWDLFADISSFCTPARKPYLERIKTEIKTGTISAGRFLYGSDFPTVIVDINNPFEEGGSGAKGNLLDIHYDIIKRFEFPEKIFKNAWEVLRLPVRS